MGWFKKKIKIEQFVEDILTQKMNRAVQFFHKENERGHRPLNIADPKLLEIGTAMVLFFIGKAYPDTDDRNLVMMSRAYKQAERTLPTISEAKPGNAFTWWKAFTDGLIFQEQEPRLRIACRIVWDKLFEGTPFRENSPLKTFGYFLEMEVEAMEKVQIT